MSDANIGPDRPVSCVWVWSEALVIYPALQFRVNDLCRFLVATGEAGIDFNDIVKEHEENTLNLTPHLGLSFQKISRGLLAIGHRFSVYTPAS